MTDSDKGIRCTYATLIAGDASFIRAVGIPLDEALEEDLRDNGSLRNSDDLNEVLAVDERPRNDFGSFSGIIGVVLFLTGWVTKKILDDVYTIKFQPTVKRILGQSDEQLTSFNARKKKMYQMGIWYDEQQAYILVGIVGNSFKDILNDHDLLPVVHMNAVSWIIKNGRGKSIHLYLLENGKMNITPLLFDKLVDMHRYIDKQWGSKLS